MSVKRTRSWTFIAYPDSLPDNWYDLLVDSMVPFIVSPLHDRDFNPDGEIKKAHYHIGLFYDAPKTYDQVLSLTKSLNATIPQQIGCTSSFVRYTCHLDNPDKYQYSPSDVRCGGGFFADDYFLRTRDRYNLIGVMIHYIVDNDVQEYADFLLYCLDNQPDWYYLLCDSATVLIKTFIDSYRYKRNSSISRPV